MSARTFTVFSLPRGAAMAATVASVAAASPDVVQTQHVSPFGDFLVSSQDTKSGTIDIKGNLGFVQADLTIGVALEKDELTLTITVGEPVKLGPEKWIFNIAGNTLAQKQAPSTANLLATSLDWSCIIKCGGDQILPVVVACLPSLITGPQGFIACVVGQLSAKSSDIVKCIVSSCL